MAFDKEFQITWFELAPSLQTLFLTLQSEMTVLQRNYTIMVNTLDSMQIQINQNTQDISINADEIKIIKQNMGMLESDVDTLKGILAGLDLSKIGDLTQIQLDLEQCMLDIQQIFKRLKAVEEMSEENFNDIVDLRTDLDHLTEWVQWIADLAEDIPDLRTDVDNNTEWLQWLEDFTSDLPEIRTDIDNNTEWLNSHEHRMEELEDQMADLLIDMDHNVEWMQYIHDRMEGFIDEIVTVRIDVDLVTEWYQELIDKIDSMDLLDPDFVESIWVDTIDLREDVDLNTELIKKALDWLQKLEYLTDDVVDLRTDVDINTEWLKSLPTQDDIADLRTDIDINTEWLKSLPTQDDIADLRQDIDMNTEHIETNTENIDDNLNSIIENRQDIDLNMELIQKVFNDMAGLSDDIIDKIMKYLDKTLFFNIAPKVNFLQEDTVEVYPYYRLNNLKEFVVTTDQDSTEVIYLIANDGVSTSNFDLFCGYRNNDTQEFYYSNIQVSPKCFLDSGGNKDSYITDIMSADNNYIVVYKKSDMNIASTDTSGWYLIKTKNSRNYGMWDEAVSLASIWSDNVFDIAYYEENDILFVFSKNGISWTDPKNPTIAILRTYKLSTMTFIKGYDIVNPVSLLKCNTATTSFKKAMIGDTFIIGDTGDIGITLNSNPNFQMHCVANPDAELVTLYLYNVSVLYTEANKAVPGNTAVDVAYGFLKLTFDCPKDIFDGGTSAALTCYQNLGDLVFDCQDKRSKFFTDNIDSLYMNVSYAGIKEQNYLSWHDSLTYNSYFKRFQTEDQKDAILAPDPLDYGDVNPYSTPDPINTPDACPWGKWFYKYTMAWDRFFINCSSMQYGDAVIMITAFQKDPYDVTAVIPAPASYKKVDPIGIFTEYGSSSCKMADGSARYFHAEYTGTQLKVYEYTYTESITDFVVSKTLIKTVSVSSSAWKTAAQTANVNTPSFDITTTSVFYNAVADNFVVFFVDETNNSGAWSYSDYGFLARVNSSGTMTAVFGGSAISSYSSNWTYINSYVQSAKSTNGATPRLRCMTFLSATEACCCYFYNCPVYSNEEFRNVSFTFNAAGTTMTMVNRHNFTEDQYLDKFPRGTGPIYSGPTYGLTFSGIASMNYMSTAFLTQKRMVGFWGANLSESAFLGGTFNTYRMQLKSSTGLVCYVPNIAIFLGGYFTQLENPLTIVLYPNANNYIYLERDGTTREIIAYAMKKRYIQEGARTFNRICVAKVVTNTEDVVDIEYYRINNGYNDYDFA